MGLALPLQQHADDARKIQFEQPHNGPRTLYLVLSTPYGVCPSGAIAIIALCALGCNRGPTLPTRGPLSGKITLDGKPVANGQIRLMSLEPNGINAAVTVTNGEYRMPADQGPAKGKYRVEFSVPSATKRRIPNDDIPGQWLEEAPETLPPRYHRDSTITFDYDPATSKSLDYDLRSH